MSITNAVIFMKTYEFSVQTPKTQTQGKFNFAKQSKDNSTPLVCPSISPPNPRWVGSIVALKTIRTIDPQSRNVVNGFNEIKFNGI